MELLPHDVIEYILERLDVKTLLRFKSVSKQWKSTITQCRSFQERQLFRRKQSGHPNVALVSFCNGSVLEALRTLEVRSSSPPVKIPTTWETKFYEVCKSSCDGLICLYDRYNPSIVVNPATRWHRTLPLSNYQLAGLERIREIPSRLSSPGFGKDRIKGTYKPVWLYNSAELSLRNENATSCAVFDFTTDAWRYVVPASPCLILPTQAPVYLDGSLHWFTKGETKEVLRLDLHTETFQVMSSTPFIQSSPRDIIMCPG